MNKRLYLASLFDINNNLNKDINNSIRDSIFTIISKYNIEYTDNQNGVFINQSLINDAIIDNIYSDILFYINKKDVSKTDTIKDEIVKEEKCLSNTLHVYTKDILSCNAVDKYVLSLSRVTLTI